MYQFAPEANFYVTEGDVSFILNNKEELELENINFNEIKYIKKINTVLSNEFKKKSNDDIKIAINKNMNNINLNDLMNFLKK